MPLETQMQYIEFNSSVYTRQLINGSEEQIGNILFLPYRQIQK